MKKFVFICVFGLFCSISVANSMNIKELEAQIAITWPDSEKVLEISNEAIKLYPKHIYFYEAKSKALLNLKRYIESTESSNLAKKYKYEMAKPTTLRGFELELIFRSDWQNTIDICDDAIKLYPKHAIFYYEKARALSQLGRYHEAIENYDLAMKYNQKILKSKFSIGGVYFLKGQSLEALDQLEEALKNYKLAIEHGHDDRWVEFAIAGVELKLHEEKKKEVR